MTGRDALARERRATPVHVGLAALAVAVAFCAGRYLGPAHHDLARFVLFGDNGVVDPRVLGVPARGVGYDGQFYFRLALDPLRLDGVLGGLRLDTPLRAQRIGYPALAWLLSGGGRPAALPVVLVAVNVAAFALVAAVGAVWARRHGWSVWAGLAFCAFPGFVVTLSRDLTELLSCLLILAAIVAMERRPWLCGLLLCGAVLTRETALVVPVAIALWRLVEVVRRRARPGTADLVWIAPVAVFAGWQAYVAHRLGAAPILSERSNADAPGQALAGSVRGALGRHTPADLVYAAGILLVAGLVLAVLISVRRVPPMLTVAVCIGTLLAVSLSSDVWNSDPAEIRVLAELATLCVAGLVAARRRVVLVVAVAAAGVLWLLDAVLYLRSP